ncbi:MAG: amidase [Propionibacteriaceae bacterium]|jgi:amidase|nr:amidase [Propionibacteriaceae bacterium]
MSAIETAAAIRSGEVSALEVTEAALQRAEAIGPSIGAFVTLTPERAFAQAEAIDSALRAGTAPSEREAPFLGVPCPIKDLDDVAGVPCKYGSLTYKDNVPDKDSDIARVFARAGTVMIGKTNTPEFGLPCYTEPDVAPPAATPWDPTRSAGGSSGGAAAAVAAGIVPIAQGSDGGGSIRIPASSCGVVGLKPSRGLVSPGGANPGPGLACYGVLTRDVHDTAAALDFMAGPAYGDLYQAPRPGIGYLAASKIPVSGLRIGVLSEPVVSDAQPEAVAYEALAEAAKWLEELGNHIEKAPKPFDVEEWNAFKAVWAVGALGVPVREEAEIELRPLTRWLRELGRGYTALELSEAWLKVQELGRRTQLLWKDFDIILTPTLAQSPAKIGQLRNDKYPSKDFDDQCAFTPWTSMYNISGLPAISLPLHTAVVDGVELPIGVQLGAGYGQEGKLLSVAAQLERVHPWKMFWE